MVWLPPILLLLAAAIGTPLTRRAESGSGPTAPTESAEGSRRGVREWRRPEVLALLALGLTVVTVALLLVAHSGRECGTPAPAWSDLMLWAALLAGLAASVLGLVALTLRRWIAALVSIPAALLAFFGLVATACLS